MAKLVKLTSDEGINTNSNSFKVQSDDDIIIAPNSTVSLLNGHISSGILSNYKIENEAIIGRDNGTIAGSLYLVADPTKPLDPNKPVDDPTNYDRKRDVLVKTGDYSIIPMTNELTRAFNTALVYNSTSTMISNTSNTLSTPSALDFGLETLVTLDNTKKVEIKYSTAAQKTTADFSFSNKSPGVQIDAQGNITYTTPSGYAQADLVAPLANNTTKQVFTASDPTGSFSQYDSVTLTNKTGSEVRPASIRNIVLAGSSTDNALALDPTKADTTNLVVYSAANYTTINGISINPTSDITTDDGTGTASVPAANVAHGKIMPNGAVPPAANGIELEFNNTNYLITETTQAIGLGGVPQFNFLQAPILNQDGTYTFVIDSPFADAVTNHFLVDAVYYITNTTDAIECLAQATAVNENVGTNPSTISLVCNVQPYQGKAPTIANMNKINCFEVMEFDDDNRINTPMQDGHQIGVFDKDHNLLCTFEIDTIVNTGGTFLINALAGSLVRESADGTALLTGMDAMADFIRIVLDPAFDETQAYVINVDRVLSDSTLDPTTVTIADGDTYAIADDGNTLNVAGLVAATPYGYTDDAGDEYTIFPINPNLATALDTYKYRKELFPVLLISNEFRIFKDDNTARIKITLLNCDNPANLATATRIWSGTNVVDTYAITVAINSGGKTPDLTKYDLMLKGTIVRTPDQAYCVEDNRLAHGCGRIAFLVISAKACEFGVMPETNDFNSQTTGSNNLRIAIENSKGGYLGYSLYRGSGRGSRVSLKRSIVAKDGDRVVIQYGVSSSSRDFEYVEGGAINNATSANAAAAAAAANTEAGSNIIAEEDRSKILISIVRTGRVNDYIYLGCPISDPNIGAADTQVSMTIPWTPRSNPYIEPQYWDSTINLHAYVCPNQATIRMLELTPTPTITFSNGVYIENPCDPVLVDTTKAPQHPDLVDEAHRLKTLANYYNFQFSNLNIQKSLGYKSSTNVLNGSQGKWVADLPYISALLPENLCILLDTLPSVQTYDLGKTNGRRRSIIGVVVNSQDRAGEIVIEPSNLYKIKLNNKEPINLRRFVVSLEDFYGKQVILQSARAVINLLFEEPTA